MICNYMLNAVFVSACYDIDDYQLMMQLHNNNVCSNKYCKLCLSLYANLILYNIEYKLLSMFIWKNTRDDINV